MKIKRGQSSKSSQSVQSTDSRTPASRKKDKTKAGQQSSTLLAKLHGHSHKSKNMTKVKGSASTTTPTTADPTVPTALKEESAQMEWQRRLDVQEVIRRTLEVPVSEAREPVEHESSGETLSQGPEEHPLFQNRQDLDGIDPDADVNIHPAASSDARREFDNQRREQELQKRLELENRLENQNQYHNTPRPKGP